ncbi:MAG: urea ABC transporter ATP-binding protein UrtD [Gammaproteobacteria bacterium]|nr:urea ABC transporter ATP-binding protein UrtD [Gammaproteobacteria bacterium]
MVPSAFKEAAVAYLETNNLSVSFDGFKAVDSLNLNVNKGELRCLIGANGAGKSTTLDLLCGKTAQTSGSIKLDGLDITSMHDHARARAGIGRKFQVPSVFKEMSVRQNLQLAVSTFTSVWATIKRLPGSDGGKRINEVVELTGLQDRLNTQAGFLSHGETQWLEIAMLLIQDSKVILMDEPTAGMTIGETQKTAQIFNSLKGKHTLLVVEHDMTFVREIAEIITVMHQGKILAEGTVEQIEVDPKVREAYLGSGDISHA